MIINNPPIPDDSDGDGYDTDTEFNDDPYDGGIKTRKPRKNKTRISKQKYKMMKLK